MTRWVQGRYKWTLVTGSALLACTPLILATKAYERNKLNRVILVYNSETPAVRGVREGLKKLNYVEGKNLILDMVPRKELDKLSNPALAITKNSANVIVTIGSDNTARVNGVIKGIPIVFAPASSPIESGFINSLARPGTNLTGLAYEPDFTVRGRELEIFREVVPSLKRVLILYDGSLKKRALQRNSAILKNAAQKLSLNFTERTVGSIRETVDIVSSLTRHETNGVFVVCTHLLAHEEPVIRARRNKIPFYGCPNQIDALVSYAPDMYQLGQRGAWYVDQILKGAKPEDLPVETPRKFALTINLNTANAIGLTIPAEMLQRADKVIR